MRLLLGGLGLGAERAERGWKSMYSPCGLQTCRNNLLMRSVQSRVGMSVGESWYCSVDCFVEAARKRYTALAERSVMEMSHSPRLPIGLVMVSKGYLTVEQHRLAIAESELRDEPVEEAALRLRLVSERQVAAARAAQWGYPTLGQERAGQIVRADVPVGLLRAYSAAPLHASTTAKRFLLGFVYRVEHSLLNSLEAVTGFRAEPCFITPSDFEDQMEHLMGDPDRDEAVYDDLKTPAQMAKIVGGYAVDLGAREAVFADCRDYIWTRLLGKRRTTDILFRLRNTGAMVPGRNLGLAKESLRLFG